MSRPAWLLSHGMESHQPLPSRALPPDEQLQCMPLLRRHARRWRDIGRLRVSQRPRSAPLGGESTSLQSGMHQQQCQSALLFKAACFLSESCPPSPTECSSRLASGGGEDEKKDASQYHLNVSLIDRLEVSGCGWCLEREWTGLQVRHCCSLPASAPVQGDRLRCSPFTELS